MIIDLGEAGWSPGIDERPRPLRSYRLLGLALAAVAVLVTGAADPVAPGLPAPARIPVAPGEDVFLNDGWLFVLGPRGDGPNRTLSGYGVPDGVPHRVIDAPTQVGTEYVFAHPFGDAFLVSRFGADDRAELRAVDARTGRLRWRRAGGLSGTIERDARSLVLLAARTGTQGGPGGAERITAVDARTGAVAWAYDLPAGASVARASEPDALDLVVTALPSGRLEARAGATGRMMASVTARTPAPPHLIDHLPPWLYLAGGDLALVVDEQRRQVSAYGLPALDRRWTVPAPGRGSAVYSGTGCGDALCVQTADARLYALDRRTGRLRWAQRRWLVGEAGGRLIVTGDPSVQDRQPDVALLDPVTGAVVADLGRWQVAGTTAAGAHVLVRYDPRSWRAWVGLLEPGASDVSLLGVVRDVISDCQASANGLMCRDRRAAVLLYPLP